MKAPVLNKVVDNFNTKYVKLDDKLDQFRSMHGIEIGLRYRLNRVGFELSWSSISDRSDYIGNINGTFHTRPSQGRTREDRKRTECGIDPISPSLPGQPIGTTASATGPPHGPSWTIP